MGGQQRRRSGGSDIPADAPDDDRAPRVRVADARRGGARRHPPDRTGGRSEEHTSELQARPHVACPPLLEKKKDEKVSNLSVSCYCTARGIHARSPSTH